MLKVFQKRITLNKIILRMKSNNFTKEELKKKLTPLQYRVTQEKGTDRPFEGKWTYHFEKKGYYLCIVCEFPLFKAQTKYEASCGWPAFYDGLANNITKKADNSHGLNRVEVLCKNCESHLGHVFNDGPKKNGIRYCINSSSMTYNKEK